MKAYQIVMKGDKRSEKYAQISRESFEPLINAGIIDEIITFDAITPDSDNFEEHVNRYTWHPSIMKADLQGSKPEDHSPTEKAGMCSHWELIRMASESDEKFLVLEHDTYFLPEHFDIFCELIDRIKSDENIHYANLGLFMGCYTLSQRAAHWMTHILTKRAFPINCGPYCTLQRLFATFTTHRLRIVDENYHDLEVTCIHPYHNCETLYFGKNVQIPFNKYDPNPSGNKWKTPTTQVVSKTLAVTQDHHGYEQKFIDAPWTRHRYFHVID